MSWSRANSVFGAGVITILLFSSKLFRTSNLDNLASMTSTLRYSIDLDFFQI